MSVIVIALFLRSEDISSIVLFILPSIPVEALDFNCSNTTATALFNAESLIREVLYIVMIR